MEQNNIAYLSITTHCAAGNGQRLALRWVIADLQSQDYTFADLESESNRMANLLCQVGVQSGDRVAIFLPKLPEVFFGLLGILKLQAIALPLFSNFGEDALFDRLADAGVKAIISKKSLLRKLNNVREKVPSLQSILLVDVEEHQENGVYSLPLLRASASELFTVPPTPADTPSLLHYTSGSTGKPKGVLHHHRAWRTIRQTAEQILQIQPDELYWCTADQAWITGTSYGVFAPWLVGAPQLQFSGAFSADVWCQILEKFKVQRWFTAPTALRMMIQQEEFIQRKYDYSHLSAIFSVGEPLNPEVIHWGRRFFGMVIHDTWFQTETGAIMIANRPGLPVRPGSMGQPVDGIHAAILAEDGSPAPLNEQGYLCLLPGWDSMFTTYWNNPGAYNSKFKNGYYYTGDMASQDADGYYWFVGRTDDVINTAGHLVSPFEVESALLENPEVIDAGVIAAPDDLLFECVVAYIRLKADLEWTKDMELKLKRYVSNRVSSTACPKDIIPVPAIPKNKSGKIMRRLLKAWYTGQDAGDISTMEEN
jgi:acetyl-CoA synthetase